MSGSPTSDDTGRPVALPARVRRVVSLVPSLTEAVAVTAPGLLVGATDWCAEPAGLEVARIGGTKNPRVADVLDLAPDLVLANEEENRAADLDALRAAGLAVWVTAPETLPAALVSLERMLAACRLDRPAWLDDAAAAWAEPYAGERRRAVVPIWRRPWMALGRDTFAGDLLTRLGVDNVLAGSPDRYPKVALDELPPYDLVVLPDEPYAFSADDGPEAFPGVPAALVSGRHLTWYGPSLAEARQVLTAQLLDAHLDAVLVGGRRPVVVQLSEYDPAWPAQFEQHRQRVVAALGRVPVEHVGSTSVPGLAAKPVIDVQVVVPELDDAVARLEAVGYPLRVREPAHRMVQGRGANVHLYLPGDPEPGAVLRFRDRLRTDAAARQRYEQVKRSLAGRQWPDMNHYAAAKGSVIREILDSDGPDPR